MRKVPNYNFHASLIQYSNKISANSDTLTVLTKQFLANMAGKDNSVTSAVQVKFGRFLMQRPAFKEPTQSSAKGVKSTLLK